MNVLIEIKLGDDAMQSHWHVADALGKIVADLSQGRGDLYEGITRNVTAEQAVWDVNGNRVGIARYERG